ncbi:MAG: hypothetical protein HOB52_05795, partial [Euryarchaeota archaeon]|nr:hypothetical protein [Euryarchaeota archaeon]
MQTLANPKKKLTKTIIITLMFLLVPMTAFASAIPTYMAGIENVCDLTLTDNQNNIYDEQDIEDFGQGNYGHYTRVIVEPSVYSLNIDCVSNLNSGEISVDLISVLDQDGINNFNPNNDWNTIQSST